MDHAPQADCHERSSHTPENDGHGRDFHANLHAGRTATQKARALAATFTLARMKAYTNPM